MATGLLVFVVALAAAHALPIEQSNQNIVPGVFISSETLKELQDKAQRNENSAITNQGVQPITNSGRSVLSPSSDEPKVGSANTQTVSQSQPTILASQAVLSQPTVSASQPAVMAQQPQIVAQPQQSAPTIVVAQAQPNQAYVLQQPNQQPIFLSQQPNTQLVPQSSQVVLSNGQVAQVITNGQPIINGQPLVNNAQPVVSNGQQLLVSTNPGSNQYTLIQGPRTNPVQGNTGLQYAVVPVAQNNVAPNTNLGTGTSNTYVMVPGSNQLYAISG